MASLTRLTDTLFTGGDLSEDVHEAVHEVEAWKSAGIGTIIDTRFEWNDAELVAEAAPELRYEHLGIDDAGQRVPPEWFDDLIDAATPRHDDAAPGVLVHCHMGINRGPSAAYALLLDRGYGPVEAIDLIRRRRPIAAIGYAEDGLDWWHQRNDMDPAVRREQRAALAEWRRRNPAEMVRMLRGDPLDY